MGDVARDDDEAGLAAAFHAAYVRVPPPAPGARRALRQRLAEAAAERDGARPGGLAWLLQPITLRFTPLGVLAAALLLAVVAAAAYRMAPTRFSAGAGAPGRVAPVRLGDTAATPLDGAVLVHFVCASATGARVALVGDFNGWDPGATPMQAAGHGRWTASVALTPGRHLYAFVVDGTTWLPDPAAPLAPEDGFGSRNSVVIVGGRSL